QLRSVLDGHLLKVFERCSFLGSSRCERFPEWRLGRAIQKDIELGLGALPLLLQHREFIEELRQLDAGFEYIHLGALPCPKTRIRDRKEVFEKINLLVMQLDRLLGQ